jgi:hypothetical protein
MPRSAASLGNGVDGFDEDDEAEYTPGRVPWNIALVDAASDDTCSANSGCNPESKDKSPYTEKR